MSPADEKLEAAIDSGNPPVEAMPTGRQFDFIRARSRSAGTVQIDQRLAVEPHFRTIVRHQLKGILTFRVDFEIGIEAHGVVVLTRADRAQLDALNDGLSVWLQRRKIGDDFEFSFVIAVPNAVVDRKIVGYGNRAGASVRGERAGPNLRSTGELQRLFI